MKAIKKLVRIVLVLSLFSTLLTGCGVADVETALDTIDKINDALTIDIETGEADSDTNTTDETSAAESADMDSETNMAEDIDAEDKIELTSYHFRYDDLLESHYEKHGIEMGFDSKESYEAAASAVINNPNALHKKEAEDNDDVYYVEETNEFVILSQDGYIRTYFYPSAGKKYYDRQ